MISELKDYLRLSEQLIKKDNEPPVNLILSRYAVFFRWLLSLVDAISLNDSEILYRVMEKIIEEFLQISNLEESQRYPCFVKDLTPSRVLDVLSLLDQGRKEIIREYGIYFYSMSMMIPVSKLDFWGNFTSYGVVSKEQFESLKQQEARVN